MNEKVHALGILKSCHRMSVLFLALCVFAALPAMAVPVWHTDDGITMTGNRGIGNGVVGNGDWASDFDLEWTITDNGDGTFHYIYDFSDLSKDLSHLILEVSETFTLDNLLNSNRSNEPEDPQVYSEGPSNPGMPDDIFGIKFAGDSGSTYTLEFDSTRAPMWGNFYAVDGKNEPATYAYNTGLADLTSENVLDFIAVPDTVGTEDDPLIPEPATLALIGLGLSGMVFRRCRKSRP
jgi:hypothetical protein